MTSADGTIDVTRTRDNFAPEDDLPPLSVSNEMPTIKQLHFGCCPIGGMFKEVPEEQAITTLQMAVNVCCDLHLLCSSCRYKSDVCFSDCSPL